MKGKKIISKKEIQKYQYTLIYFKKITNIYIKITLKDKSFYGKTINQILWKIKLIITIYNQENFLKYAYFYIQKQELKDIEIIFVDDASSDNSSKLIYSLMKNDKRIIYIRNKVNKGAFHSRNEGILLSKGKYILIHDPDDLLLYFGIRYHFYSFYN